MTNVAVFTGFRIDIGEYANVRTHIETDDAGRTLCGLDLTRVQKWERTTYPHDCKRCAKSLEVIVNGLPR